MLFRSSSCWKVTWYDKYVEVILSGEEQSDEQVLLYFNCEVEVNEKPCAHELRRSYAIGQQACRCRIRDFVHTLVTLR